MAVFAAQAGVLSEALFAPGVKPHRITETLLTEEVIARRVQELGTEIGADYANLDEPLLLIGVLKGAALFLADLARAIPRPVEYDFVTLSSYGAGMETSGRVQVLGDVNATVAGKHVLIVEDILDTGLTLERSRLSESLRERNAVSVKVCVLLDKPARRRAAIPIDYRGFEIEDKFVVGYGMDYGELYRNLPYIGVVSLYESA